MITGIEYIRSDKDIHFTGAITENAKEDENIQLPANWRNNHLNSILIRNISIISDQNLEWDLFLWSKDTADDTDLDADTFVDFINFQATIGKQIGGSGQYYYSLSNLFIPYYDDDNTGKIHCSIINRSVTAKNAGATGEIVVIFSALPVLLP